MKRIDVEKLMSLAAKTAMCTGIFGLLYLCNIVQSSFKVPIMVGTIVLAVVPTIRRHDISIRKRSVMRRKS